MSQPTRGQPPYRVVYSDACREEIRLLLLRANEQGRLAEIAQVLRDVETRLAWIPLDFGEPLRDLDALGLQVLVGTSAPVVVTYSVDEVRCIVYITAPFKLLPNSGL